ncbi:MAG: prephenate dehydratase [Eubacterium sp.]|nr:prephenate dehydratase [Eubacterium sp.]
MVDLLDSRKKIDEIDEQIVKLYEKRMAVAGDVAEYKLQTGKKVYDKEREDSKLETLCAMVDDKFNKRAVKELFTQIMSVSRKYQYGIMSREGYLSEFSKCDIDLSKTKNVYYFGVPGSYTQAAMKKIFGDEVEGISEKTFRGVMEAVADGRAEYGVLPIENSSTGGISANYDIIPEYDNYIVGQKVMKIEQCLLGLPGTKEEDIKIVYSHPQGIMQCRNYLEKRDDIKSVDYDSTAAAAKKVQKDGDTHQGAIASKTAAKEYGLEIIREGIQDNSYNKTRFIVLSKNATFSDDSDKISLCIELPHTSGSLYRILSHFLFNDLNLTLIESRPIPGRTWEYRFFIDVEGNIKDPAVENALLGIREEAALFKVLGNYKEYE